tara:strand:- start:23704 stop:28176 length:4473 start_codon:yes stop_codon:yes gene_type:complete
MPKKLHEIKGFHTGTISNPSETDVPADSNVSSLDIDNHLSAGSLKGRYGNKSYDTGGYTTNNYTNGVFTIVITAANTSHALNNLNFNISSPHNDYLFYLSSTGASPAAQPPAARSGTEDENVIQIQVDITNNDTIDQVGEKIRAKINTIGVFSASYNVSNDTITVTQGRKGIFNAPTANNSGFTFAVTTPGVLYNIDTKSSIFIKDGEEHDFFYVDNFTNRLNRISDFYNKNSNQELKKGNDISDQELSLSKTNKIITAGRGKSLNPKAFGYLNNDSLEGQKGNYFESDAELSPPDGTNPFGRFTRIIKVSNDDSGLYGYIKGQPYIWRIKFDHTSAGTLGSAFRSSKLNFKVDHMCNCVSASASDSYVWIYDGPGNDPNSLEYNSFSNKNYNDDETEDNPGSFYKLKVNAGTPIDWESSPPVLSSLKQVNIAFETNKAMDWTHDNTDSNEYYSGKARLGDMMETGNHTKGILWFLIIPVYSDENELSQWFRFTRINWIGNDASGNHNGYDEPNSIAKGIANSIPRWLYAANGMEAVDESGGVETITFNDKTPQHMGLLETRGNTNLQNNPLNLPIYQNYSGFSFNDGNKGMTEGIWAFFYNFTYKESDQTFTMTSYDAHDATHQTVYTIAKNIGMICAHNFSQYIGDNCGTANRRWTDTGAGASNIGDDVLPRIAPLEFSLVNLSADYGIDEDGGSGNAVVGCMTKYNTQPSGIWLVNRIDSQCNNSGSNSYWNGMICDTVDSNSGTYVEGSSSDEYRVDVSGKTVMYVCSYLGNEGAMHMNDTDGWTSAAAGGEPAGLGNDGDFASGAHKTSTMTSDAPDTALRQARLFNNDDFNTISPSDFHGVSMIRKVGTDSQANTDNASSKESTFFVLYKKHQIYGPENFEYFTKLLALDARVCSNNKGTAASGDVDANIFEGIATFNQSSYSISFDGDGDLDGLGTISAHNPRMQDPTFVVEEFNAGGTGNAIGLHSKTVDTRLVFFDRSGSMSLKVMDLVTDDYLINSTDPVDQDANNANENYTFEAFGQTLTDFGFGGSDSIISAFTPSAHSQSKSNFIYNTTYYYKVSFLYDGYQESPLTSFPWTFNANAADSGNYNADTDNYEQLELSLKLSNIVPRISHLNIYRTDDPNKLYRLIKSIPLDSTWVEDENQIFQKTYIDIGNSGASYEAINNMPQDLRKTQPNYTISEVFEGSLFIGNCYHSNIVDGSTYIFKSQPGNFNQFNWSQDFLKLPNTPTAMKSYLGRLYVWDESNMYVVNSNLIIEDTYEGIGCLNSKAVTSCDAGMCFADSNNIYLQTQGYPQIISNPIATAGDSTGYQDLLNPSTFNPKIYYISKITSFIVIVNSSFSWLYNVSSRRWDRWTTTNIESGILGKDNELLLSETYGEFHNLACNSASRENYTWKSKKLTMGFDSQDKFFKKTRVTGTNANVIDTTATSKGSLSPTYTDDTDNAEYTHPTGATRKGKWIQYTITNESNEVDSIATIYRDRNVK